MDISTVPDPLRDFEHTSWADKPGSEPAKKPHAKDPVDHDRKSGVPPETNDDLKEEDQEDFESAQSFPASDPPGNY
jgi:hypothetical protein